MFGRKARSHFKAVFLQKDKNGFIEIDSTFIQDVSSETFSYKGHSYEVNLENDVFTDRKGVIYLFYEATKGNMLTFKQAKALMSTEELDDFIAKNIFGQLARVLRESLQGVSKGWLVPIIVGAILGIAIGYFIGMNYSPVKTVVEYYNQTQVPHI